MSVSYSDIEPHSFTKDFNLSGFKYEKRRFEEYLCNDSESDERSNIGRVFLFIHKRTQKLIGFVTLAMNHLPREKHAKLENITRHGTIPGLLLGQIARDPRYKRTGVGKIMLDWVINHAIELSKEVGQGVDGY